MKVVCLVAILTVGLVHGNFMGYLKDLETHAEFQSLTTDQRLLFAELVMATETNKLKEFIDRVGYLAVVQLLDDMAYADSHKFMAYLSEALGYHNHAPGSGSILHKRDNGHHFGNDMGDHHNIKDHLNNNHDNYYHHLSDADKKIWDGLKDASDSNSVTAYIDQVGMGAILGLMEKMDPAHAQELFTLLETQLRLEALVTTK